MKNKSLILISLLVSTLSITPSTIRPAAPDTHTVGLLHGASLGLDLVRIVLTNVAMIEHKDNPVTAAKLHAAAAATGIAGNLVLAKLLHNNPQNATNGGLLAVSSALSANIVDLAIHIGNAHNGTPYEKVSTSQIVSIQSAQILELISNYLSNYWTSDITRSPAFQTAMHNLHAGVVSLEKILLSNTYTPAIVNQQIATIIFASSALLNAGSFSYYGIKEIKHQAAIQLADDAEANAVAAEAAVQLTDAIITQANQRRDQLQAQNAPEHANQIATAQANVEAAQRQVDLNRRQEERVRALLEHQIAAPIAGQRGAKEQPEVRIANLRNQHNIARTALEEATELLQQRTRALTEAQGNVSPEVTAATNTANNAQQAIIPLRAAAAQARQEATRLRQAAQAN